MFTSESERSAFENEGSIFIGVVNVLDLSKQYS